jgi:hypothetical protein
MDTVTLTGSTGLAGQGLTFEGTYVTASFRFGDFEVPTVFNTPSTFDWNIGGATVQTKGTEYASSYSYYQTTQADVGKTMSVSATVPYLGEIHTATSQRSLTVLNVNDLPTGGLRIEGDTKVAGTTLRAVSTIADEDGLGTLSYQWKADGQAIAGATGSSLVLSQLDAGKTITVVASYVDGSGEAESVASDADPAAVHQNTRGSASLNGPLAASQTLRVSVSDPDHSGKVYYQWQNGDGQGKFTDILGANGSELAIGASAPAALRVLTTYADHFGVVEYQATVVGTDGNDDLKGDATTETFMAYGGNDTIRDSGSYDSVDGGAGLDTWITAHSEYMFGRSNTNPDVWVVPNIIDMSQARYLTNVERVLFQNGATGVALDFDGHAGQAYRLYQAAFDRAPDQFGVGFWISRLDKGVKLADIANAFVASSEFKTLYGANPTNAEIVAKFYQHVLNREPDPQSQFWVDVLDRKAATVAEVLVGFSESAENMAALVGVRDTGIDYLPYTAD